MSFIRDLAHSVRRRFSEASRLCGPGDVLVSFYDSLLRYGVKLPLPFRGRVRRIGLKKNGMSCLIRLGFSDGSVFDDICIRGIYDAVGRAGNADVSQVVDLGANIGVSLRLWAAMFPDARITAVEPDESNFEMCRLNAKADEGRITLICGFAAGQSGSAYLNPGHVACSNTMAAEPVENAAAIRAFTLPEILAIGKVTGSIDLLKCDIEGSERELFADCSAWIGKVRQLMIELHTPYTTELFLADLARAGSTLKVIWSSEESPLYPMLFLRS